MKKATALALAGIAALAFAGPAAAKPKAGKFQLSIKGEQLTTWTYSKVMKPSCDFPDEQTGRQYIEFSTYEHGDAANPVVKAKKGKRGAAVLKFARDDITISAEAQAERSYSTLYSQITPCGPGGGPYGGGDPPQDAIGVNRCEQRGSLDPWLGNEIGEVEHPYYTTDLPEKGPKAALYFSADAYWLGSGSDHSLPAACASEGQPGADIGLAESQGEWPGNVIPIVGSVPFSELMKLKRNRKAKFELGRTVTYPNDVQTYAGPPSTKGKTRSDATFTFKRLGR